MRQIIFKGYVENTATWTVHEKVLSQRHRVSSEEVKYKEAEK